MTARWLTPNAAADHTGFSVDTICDALRDGSLRGYQRKAKGRWRIAVEELDAWVKGEVAVVEIPSVTHYVKRGRS
jgi:excisionase family DNA binding protein